MMQTLSKTELAWIYNALDKEVKRKISEMNQCEAESPLFHLAELRRDNLRATMHKIHNVLNGESKRIAIK
jgi:hypothetical protein